MFIERNAQQKRQYLTRGNAPGSAQGSALIEWALLMGVLVIMATAMVDASNAWRTKHVLNAAAREGARMAATLSGLVPNDAQVLSVVDSLLATAGIPVAGITRTVQFALPVAVGTPVTVSIQLNYQPVVTGLLPESFGGIIPLQASVTMRYTGR